MKAHVTSKENKRFKRAGYTIVERQVQYARAILRSKPNVTLKYVSEALIWKFGYNTLDKKTYNELKG